jgi:hypothetical protein
MYEITKAMFEAKEKREGETIEHNGRTYWKVRRKAIVGDLVLITKFEDEEVNEIVTVTKLSLAGFGDFRFAPAINGSIYFDNDYEEYFVLELVAETQPKPDLADLVANLARGVAELKRRVDANTGLLVESWEAIDDLERAVDEIGENQENFREAHLLNCGILEDINEDIRTLDARTQPLIAMIEASQALAKEAEEDDEYTTRF